MRAESSPRLRLRFDGTGRGSPTSGTAARDRDPASSPRLAALCPRNRNAPARRRSRRSAAVDLGTGSRLHHKSRPACDRPRRPAGPRQPRNHPPLRRSLWRQRHRQSARHRQPVESQSRARLRRQRLPRSFRFRRACPMPSPACALPESKFCTTRADDAPPADRARLAHPTAFLIGNEGNGVPEEIACLADGAIRIPCPGPVESLNAAVAASVLLYEASRQRPLRLAVPRDHRTGCA